MNKLNDIYNKSSIAICLGYDETFCLNAIEANSCGLPVLTFGKTALNEIVRHNHNGFVVDNFQGHRVGDAASKDYENSMDFRAGELRAKHITIMINTIKS